MKDNILSMVLAATPFIGGSLINIAAMRLPESQYAIFFICQTWFLISFALLNGGHRHIDWSVASAPSLLRIRKVGFSVLIVISATFALYTWKLDSDIGVILLVFTLKKLSDYLDETNSLMLIYCSRNIKFTIWVTCEILLIAACIFAVVRGIYVSYFITAYTVFIGCKIVIYLENSNVKTAVFNTDSAHTNNTWLYTIFLAVFLAALTISPRLIVISYFENDTLALFGKSIFILYFLPASISILSRLVVTENLMAAVGCFVFIFSVIFFTVEYIFQDIYSVFNIDYIPKTSVTVLVSSIGALNGFIQFLGVRFTRHSSNASRFLPNLFFIFFSFSVSVVTISYLGMKGFPAAYLAPLPLVIYIFCLLYMCYKYEIQK